MTTYHERVARVMSQSVSVGSLNSYETILAATRERFPTEEELRRYVGVLEKMAQILSPEFKFIIEDDKEASHEHRNVAG